MRDYFKLWKDLKKEIGLPEILDAFFASLLYGLIILLPMGLIFAQFISMYYHLLTLWTILIIISIMGLSVIQLLLWKKSLLLKKPDLSVNINKLLVYQAIVNGGVILVIGLLFIFIFIPMMQI